MSATPSKSCAGVLFISIKYYLHMAAVSAQSFEVTRSRCVSPLLLRLADCTRCHLWLAKRRPK